MPTGGNPMALDMPPSTNCAATPTESLPLYPKAEAQAGPYVTVVGRGDELERPGGAARVLRSRGLAVCPVDFWDDPARLAQQDKPAPRPSAIVVEAANRPELAIAAIRSFRDEPPFT